MLSEIKEYLAYLENKEAEQNTIRQYERKLEYLHAFLIRHYFQDYSDVPVGAITAQMLGGYYRSIRARNLKSDSRQVYVSPIRSFFLYLTQANHIESNPAAALPKVKKSKKELSAEAIAGDEPKYDPEKVSQLFDAILTKKQTLIVRRNIAVLATILATAMRASEVCSLNVSDFEKMKAGSVICRQKGGYNSAATVAEFCIPYIETYLQHRANYAPDDPLFVSQKTGADGKPNRLTVNALHKCVSDIQREAGLVSGLHCLRSAIATDLHRVTHDEIIVRDTLRHKPKNVTGRYIKSFPAARKAGLEQTEIAQILVEKLK